jgi:hypothetical protein
MNRVGIAAMSAVCLALTLAFGALPASASSYLLEFTGTTSDGAYPFHGSLTLNVPEPPSSSGTVEQWNDYYNGSGSYSLVMDGGGLSYSGSAGVGETNISFIKSTDTANFFGAPFVAFQASLNIPDDFSIVIASINPDPSIPLMSFETMPSTLAAWVATYGSLYPYPSISSNGVRFNLSSYTLTAVAATPIPASLLMFGTGLVGLGAAAIRRHRRYRGGSESLADATA